MPLFVNASVRLFLYGVVTLLIAAMLLFAALGSNVADLAKGAPTGIGWFVLAIGILFVILTLTAWVNAIRSTEGDDLLSGQRGLLLSGMIVVTLAVAGLLTILVTNPGAWQGFIDGLRE